MLSRILNRFQRTAFDMALIAPDADLVVVGDVHGRADLLVRVLERAGSAQIVCVGDYVDRGPNSAGVLRCLQDRADIVCLGGNHEEMMQRFLEDPQGKGARWLKHGGVQTLESFGITRHEDARDARDALVTAMGTELVAWLRGLPDRFVSGNVAVVHAGADPLVAIAAQKGATLRWGHPRFQTQARKDGVWVAHGHTVYAQGAVQQGRIAVDSGAYATGRLTFARISKGDVRFEVVEDGRPNA